MWKFVGTWESGMGGGGLGLSWGLGCGAVHWVGGDGGRGVGGKEVVCRGVCGS